MQAHEPAPVKAAAPPVVETAVETGTEYVVFKQADKDVWNRVNIATARSADQAIRDVVGKLGKDQSGTYAAIPSRSFKPVTVQPHTVTTTTLKLEEAK